LLSVSAKIFSQFFQARWLFKEIIRRPSLEFLYFDAKKKQSVFFDFNFEMTTGRMAKLLGRIDNVLLSATTTTKDKS
jgi:hypothetical protein